MSVTTGTGASAPFSRFAVWLTRQSAADLFGAFLVWFVAWSVVSALVLELLLDTTGQRDVALAAAALMPALGALFAFLTAFAINSEWRQLGDAQHAVELEADAAARFAWVADSPGLDRTSLRSELRSYLQLVVVDEWPRLEHGAGSPEAPRALASLGREARTAVSADDVSPATAVELLGAADGLATSRRDRLSLARRTVPPAFLLLAFSSGVILSLNAVLLSLRIEGWAALAIMGLVVVTALDLALVVAVSEPYKGTIVVDPRPLADVVDDLDRGVFGPWGESPSGEDLGPA